MFIDSISKSKKNIANNKGFTLVELIVVLTMMAIVLTLGGLAILKWQDYATFNQENEYAQTLFVAAQNQLSEYSASGRLEVLQSDLKSDDKYGQLVAGNPTKGIVLDITTLTSESGDAYNKSEVWSEAYKIDPTGGERANKYIDDIVAIRAEAGQYETYVNDPEGFKNSNPQAYWLYEILGSYVYDTTILNDAAICVEFTPDDGQVFSVFYSDKNKSFIYSNHEAKTAGNGAADIVDRQEMYRNEYMIGFYGIEKLTKATRDKSLMAKAEIKNVMLHNENTLNLTFDLEEGEVLSLDYKVLLKTADAYDSGDFGDALEIVIPANTLKNELNDVECSVARLTTGSREELGTMKLMGRLQSNADKEPQVLLILDAADIHAGANLYKDFLATGEQHFDLFKDTYSIFRFGIDMAYAKCEVSASGVGYIDSESEESNVEHMCAQTMVAKNTENGTGRLKEYTLANARHLYNIRFLQVDIARDAEFVGANYVLSNKTDGSDDDGDSIIDWGKFQNSVTYNRLYDSKPAGAGWSVGNLPDGYNSLNTCAFPSINELGANESITALVAEYELKNFKLDSKSNVFYNRSKSCTDTNDTPVGLVGTNNGDVSKITMTNTKVRGEECVGAIAGLNSKTGEVDMCRVRNEAVDGISSVGGLVGFNAGSISAKAENITIAPNVNGTYYVGGIVGYNDTDATITNYKINKGTITGKAETSCFVGGFVGLNSSIKVLQGPDKKAIDIVSSPLKVSGAYYVGGCIGGNILNTHGYSNATDGDKPAAGNGGNITIKYDKNSDISNDNNKTIWIHFNIDNNTNNKIVDWNADLSYLAQYGNFHLENNSNSICQNGSYIVNPINEDWAKIVEPHSNLNKSSIRIVADDASIREKIEADIRKNGIKINAVFNDTASLHQMLAVVGPTQFRTSNPAPDSTKVWVEFKNTSKNTWDEGGGKYYCNEAWYEMIIHNNTDTTITGWEIRFKSNSVDFPINHYEGADKIEKDGLYILKDTPNNGWSQPIGPGTTKTGLKIKVNFPKQTPEWVDEHFNSICGELYINNKYITSFNGGTSGGGTTDPTDPTPITPDPDKIDVINAAFRNSNAAGELNGTAFVGGYIGYNMLIDSENAKAVQDYVTKAYIDAVNENSTLASKYIAVDNLAISGITTKTVIKNSDVHMWINESGSRVKNNIGTVSADICVGGIFGYNNDETNLRIFNSDNYSKVVARTAIEYANEQKYADDLDPDKNVVRTTDYEGKNKTYYYSYAGGIIGTNNKLTVIDDCANKSSSPVVSKGTYTGGLCEINDGEIINCVVENLGFVDKEYVGGLCGLNKNLVTECSFNTKTVGGANVVGGISAENYGTISNISLNHPSVIAYGKEVNNIDNVSELHGLVGTFTGYNGHTGVVNVEKDVIGASVNSSGRYAGLVIGYNSGSIVNKKTPDDKLSATDGNIVLSGSLKAYKTAGALCGYNDNKNKDFIIANYTNLTPVLTSYGEAGGIIGFNNSNNTIKFCVNDALVNAADGGNAGGITSVNNGNITNSYNYISVNAPNGMSGGITSINYGDGNIFACYVGPKAGTNTSITYISKYVCGGVAAQNAGTIEDNTLKNIVVKNYDNALGSKLGVVAGENLSTGEILLPGAPSIDNCQVIAEANDAKMGGIAGANAGLITTKGYKDDGSVNKSLVKCSLVLDKASYASMGGVAGSNTGIISHISVDADIEGNLQAGFSGYGGIAGTSGYSMKSESLAAASEANKKYPATIIDCSFDGSLHAVGTSGNPANIGGVTGVNGYGSDIDSCYLGVLGADKTSKLETVIKAGNIEKYNSDNTLDTISYANAGGIAGKNYGKISNIDMESAKYNGKITDSINIIAFAGATGGFVGYNYEGAVITGASANNRVTTTDKMNVTMLRGENNRGPGGFIGVNLSGQPMSYMDNYASVNGIFKANMKTGGFMGSNMQQESYQLLITNCNNYGTIVGYANVGGFVGHDWYRGIRFDSCVNYGQVRSEGEDDANIQKHAGGFIGRPCSTSTPHYFAHCENHGYIETRGGTRQAAAGGFIGELEKGLKITFDFYDCVNTGIVCNKDGYNDAGDERGLGNFVGYSDGGSPINLNLCRNYNTKKVVNGFSSSGICIDCLDVSLQMDEENYYKPYTNGNSINNYYVSKDALAPSSFETDANGAYFTVRSGEVFNDGNGNAKTKSWKIKRGNKEVAYDNYKNYELLFEEPTKFSNIYSSSTVGDQPLYFTVFSDDSYKGMQDFTVYFRTPSDDLYNTALYKYDYSISFIGADGSVISTSSGTVSDVKGSFDVEKYKATASVPSGKEKAVKDIVLKVSCTNASNGLEAPHLFGFSWKPLGSTDETLLSGLTTNNGMASVFSGGSGVVSVINNREYDYKINNSSFAYNFMLTDYYKNNSGCGYKSKTGYDNNGKRKSQTYTITNTFLDDSAVEFDSIRFYVSNDFINNSSETIKYSYNISLTDIEGHKYTYKDAGNQNFEIECSDQNGVILCNVDTIVAASQSSTNNANKLTSKKISKIELSMRNDTTPLGDKTNDDNDAIFLKGVTYVPSGEIAERRFAYANLGESNKYPIDLNLNSRTGVYSIYPLILDNFESTAPFLYTELNHDRGIQMSSNSPVLNSIYKNDDAAITINKNSQSGNGYVKWVTDASTGIESTEVYSDVAHSRISVYRDIDPKFLDMIKSTRSSANKLATPRYPSLVLNGGNAVFRWERVKKDIANIDVIPYGYEVEYRVYNSEKVFEEGSTLQPFNNDGKLTMKTIENGKEVSITLAQWAFPVNIEDEWIENDCKLSVRVRAVNSYRYDIGGDESKDSDWTSFCDVSLSQPLLPQPKVHIEFTSDNRMVAVLDNIEDFEKMATFAYNGEITQKPMSELCNIIVDWEGFKWDEVTNFTIDPSEGVHSKACMYINKGDHKILSAYAEPKPEYEGLVQQSLSSTLKGKFEANGEVPTRPRYNGTTITFNGFSGDGSSDLRYDISIAGGDDSFLAADFGAYDEEKGLYVYYDRATAHLGASAGGGSVTNSYSLSGIPVELFGDDSVKDMEARVYLDESQNGIVHYGHEVVDNIVLDGETKEDNYAILAAIVDENYLKTVDKATEVTPMNVWDTANNELYPGYSLYLNPDGTYKIIYNATIELSMKNAADENLVATNVFNGIERKYHNYEVDVMRYNSFEITSTTKSNRSISSVAINGDKTTVDLNYMQNGYYERRQSEIKDNAYSAFNVKKFIDANNAYKYFLDIAPAPVVEDGAISVSINEQGQKTYAVQWDKYYRDTNAWNGSYYAEDSNEANSISKISYAGLEVDKIAGSGKFTLPTVETWENFKSRTKDSDDNIFYNEYIEDIKSSGKRQWNRLAMNSYYYSYANAKYKAVLLGKTSSGEYVELASNDINTATILPSSESYSYRINYNNNSSHVKVTDNKYEYMAYQTSFTENNGEWSSYSDITIRIIRLGNEGNYGKGIAYPNKKDIDSGNAGYLFVLPGFTEVKYEQKQPLTTLLPPAVTKHDSSDVSVEGSMIYDVSFGLINDTEMIKDLGGYLIEVKSDDDSLFYLIKLENTTISSYDIPDESDVIEVASGMFTTDSANGNAMIDLYNFAGKEVEISVRALARDSSDAAPTKYCHGEFSDGTKVTLGVALPIPVVKESETNYLTVEEVKDPSTNNVIDYKLSYSDSNEKYKEFYENDDTIVTIQAKVDVYKELSDDTPIASLYGSDSPLDITKYSKSGVISSANIISESVAYEKLFEEYAGYYMKISIKASSDNADLNDSLWSDENAADGITDEMKYIEVSIPKMRVDDSSVINEITYEEKQYNISDDNGLYNVTVDQQAFNILIDSEVDNYKINLKRDANAANALVPESIVIEKKSSEEGDKWYLNNDTENVITSEKVIDNFKNEIKVNVNGNDLSIECKAYISIITTGDKQYIHLVVPDALRVSIDADNNGSFEIVEKASVSNENGFISLSTLEFVSGLNDNNSKHKEIASNALKHLYKKDELEGILAAIPAATSDEGPDDGDVPDGSVDDTTPETAGGDEGNTDVPEPETEPESVLDPVDGTDPEPVTEPESPKFGDGES